MATFIMTGKYLPEGIGKISAARTKQAEALLKKYGGKLTSAYATLGKTDVLLVVELPDEKRAIQASIALTKKFSIAFATCPAVPVAEFDKLVG